jgi:hypothetical protein
LRRFDSRGGSIVGETEPSRGTAEFTGRGAAISCEGREKSMRQPESRLDPVPNDLSLSGFKK